MRVCLVSANYAPEPTGVAPYATGLAEGLVRLGHQVEVLAAAPHYPQWRVRPAAEWAASESQGALHVQRVMSYVPANPKLVNRLFFELLYGVKFARRLPSADVVVLVSPPLFTAGLVRLRIGFGRRRPAVALWMQDLYGAGIQESAGLGSRLVGEAMTRMESTIARHCDVAVVIHDRFARYAVQTLGVDPARVHVVRNWTHVATPDPASRTRLRARFGWAPGETIALHAGNMGAKQGLENVVQAAWRAEQLGAPVRFALMGDGSRREALERAGRGCSHLQFLAPAEEADFTNVLAAADVLVLNERASLKQAAVPSKLTSYFISGLPVVAATDAGGATAEEVLASRAGVVVAPEDPAALLDGIVAVARNWGPDQASAGPRYVAERLREEVSIARFAEILQSLTSTAHPSPDAAPDLGHR